MKDLIDRQAAIDAIDKYIAGFDAIDANFLDGLKTAKQLIKDLFSVIPEPCDDVISRKAAKHALCKAVHKNEDIPCENQTASCLWSKTRVCDYAREIDALPSAQPQRMRGKWTYGEDEYGIDGYHCDKCGFFVPWDYTHKFIDFIKDYHFCPNCGADMRGEQDEY